MTTSKSNPNKQTLTVRNSIRSKHANDCKEVHCFRMNSSFHKLLLSKLNAFSFSIAASVNVVLNCWKCTIGNTLHDLLFHLNDSYLSFDCFLEKEKSDEIYRNLRSMQTIRSKTPQNTAQFNRFCKFNDDILWSGYSEPKLCFPLFGSLM